MPQKPKVAAVMAHAEAPEERQEAARQMAGKRWQNTTAGERSRFLAWVSAHATNQGRPQDQSQRRCPCKRMTLKRARARGKTKTGHLASCPFHKAA